MSNSWSESQVKRSQEMLRATPRNRYAETLLMIGEDIGRTVTPDSIKAAFLHRGLGPPTSYCAAPDWTKGTDLDTMPLPAERAPSPPAERRDGPLAEPSEDVQRLLRAVKKAPRGVEDLCDTLDAAPGKVRALIAKAQSQGVTVEIVHDQVSWRVPPPDDRIRETGVLPTIGETFWAGVISDTHLGSKYCLREQLKEFVHHCYEAGARVILHPGDVIDGIYRHGLYEVSHSGLEEQTRDLYETLPALDGLSYHFIEGNHDFTCSEASGINAGGFMQNYFESRGRDDLKCHGQRSAFLRVGGVVVNLWHPSSSPGYAVSYKLQRKIEAYSSGSKPQVLLVGHWHQSCYVETRGVHAIACPTFQGGGSAFGNSLVGAPTIGGNLIGWDLTAHGTIRQFHYLPRRYFEHERPVEIGAAA